MKIAMIAVFLVFLVGTASAIPDLAITGDVVSNYKYDNYISAMEDNTIYITEICNVGTADMEDIEVALYASDVDGGYTIVNTGYIDELKISACTDLTIVDPTIRNSQDTITYKASIIYSDPEDENPANNNMTSGAIYVRFNGYKGKWPYWVGKGNMTTTHTYNGNVSMIYYNQTDAEYRSTSWTTRTETWAPGDLVVPAGATIKGAWLYVSYNWDNTTTADRTVVPDIYGVFNTQDLQLNSSSPCTDYSNIGTYGDREYGLYLSLDVTSSYSANGYNYLYMYRLSPGYTQALYPSALVVVYEDLEGIKHQAEIIIKEGCDYLLVSEGNYGTTAAEATAYLHFGPLSYTDFADAYLYSFAASAGANEGKLFFNGDTVGNNAWQGNYYSACPYLTADLSSILSATDNEVAIQSTNSGGMFAIEQILVVNYEH